MGKFEIASTIISVLCTGISILGAYKANKYYKKTKHLSALGNIKNCLSLVPECLSDCTDILLMKARGINERGANNAKKISASATAIKLKMQQIEQAVPVSEQHWLREQLTLRYCLFYEVMDKLISTNDIDIQEKLIDKQFPQVQEILRQIQEKLKICVEREEEALK